MNAGAYTYIQCIYLTSTYKTFNFRYAKKCRFAHGQEELRCVQRHARYKTEICRTFHLTGTCLYGVRCTFIHDDQQVTSPSLSAASLSPLLSNMMHYSSPYSTLLTQPQETNSWMFDNSNKMDVWASLFNRRYSSSSISSNSSTSSSPSLSTYFI